jgi:hypothetical protein
MTDNPGVRATLRYTTTRDFQRLLFVDGWAMDFCAAPERKKKPVIDDVSNGQRQQMDGLVSGIQYIEARLGKWDLQYALQPQPSSDQ